jgi:4-hydroxybenzoate polyprenyltransferase
MIAAVLQSPYFKIARVDHWFKNVFMLPGVVVAIYIDHSLLSWQLAPRFLIALLAGGLVASSNYVLNEILDASTDLAHPVKRHRPVPSGQVRLRTAYLEWILLAVAGLTVAALLGRPFFVTCLALWIMGWVYNVPPVRTKEQPYLDVLSESVNNPLRLMLGWYATGTVLLPPISLMLAYWMIGAFFMAVKRFAEYRTIADPVRAAAYRRSFEHYTEDRLIVSVIYYAAAFGLFFGIFLMRYRMELILTVPLIAGIIAWYKNLGFKPDSPTQYPEKLYRETGFMVYLLFCITVMLLLLFIDVPFLYDLFGKTAVVR